APFSCRRTMRAHPSASAMSSRTGTMMLRAFPDLLDDIGLRPIENYGAKLISALHEVAPPRAADPRVVLLSPGTSAITIWSGWRWSAIRARQCRSRAPGPAFHRTLWA